MAISMSENKQKVKIKNEIVYEEILILYNNYKTPENLQQFEESRRALQKMGCELAQAYLAKCEEISL